MRALGWGLVLLMSGGCTCVNCPRGDRYCEGDVIMSCTTTCVMSGTGYPTCSTTVNPATDCATAELAVVGVAKTCRDITREGGRYAVCVDGVGVTCTRRDTSRQREFLRCAESGHVILCDGEGEGFENTIECGSSTACHPTSTSPGWVCLTLPKIPCDPNASYSCESATRFSMCLGTPDAGYARRTQECTPRSHCEHPDGGQLGCYPDALDGGAGDAGMPDAG